MLMVDIFVGIVAAVVGIVHRVVSSAKSFAN